ncbi:hypothetical protein BS78_10G032200 [Paspalum vaginatum]|nr:hypothetical protein BS78_10G032200 [Paspalum vaginatum]
MALPAGGVLLLPWPPTMHGRSSPHGGPRSRSALYDSIPAAGGGTTPRRRSSSPSSLAAVPSRRPSPRRRQSPSQVLLQRLQSQHLAVRGSNPGLPCGGTPPWQPKRSHEGTHGSSMDLRWDADAAMDLFWRLHFLSIFCVVSRSVSSKSSLHGFKYAPFAWLSLSLVADGEWRRIRWERRGWRTHAIEAEAWTVDVVLNTSWCNFSVGMTAMIHIMEGFSSDKICHGTK